MLLSRLYNNVNTVVLFFVVSTLACVVDGALRWFYLCCVCTNDTYITVHLSVIILTVSHNKFPKSCLSQHIRLFFCVCMYTHKVAKYIYNNISRSSYTYMYNTLGDQLCVNKHYGLNLMVSYR